ncbi:phosphotransferase family protein [Paenibacillus sp. GCM10012306]|uniref:phosphotransferase family protein n=1 Tax=Paenibacillus sp. GCM10012306 TaxID=3317342 RepID=UPI003613EF18
MISKLGKKIGEGGCSEVFEWDGAGKIVKLAKPNTSLAALQAELHHSRIARECGLPVPQPYELVHIGGRSGIVFERIYGESIMERFINGILQPSSPQQPLTVYDDYNDVLATAQLLYQIHTHSMSNMPSQRDNLKYDIRRAHYLSETDKTAVINQLNQLPLKHQLCHGDPNPNNILFRNNEAVIIDWNNASIGNPEADLAEYIIMIGYAILPDHLPSEASTALNATRENIITIFMDEYERLSGISYADIEPWIIPVAARKLSADGISEKEKNLLVNEIKKGLRCTSL